MQYLKDRKQIEKIYEERRVDADEFPLLKVSYETEWEPAPLTTDVEI